jgi:hypothetical protein
MAIILPTVYMSFHQKREMETSFKIRIVDVKSDDGAMMNGTETYNVTLYLYIGVVCALFVFFLFLSVDVCQLA